MDSANVNFVYFTQVTAIPVVHTNLAISFKI